MKDVIDIVRVLVKAILELVPVDVAQQLLTDEAVRRANAIADAGEVAKFGGGQ